MNYQQYNPQQFYYPPPNYQNQFFVDNQKATEEKELKRTMNGIGTILLIAVAAFFICSLIFSIIYMLIINRYEFTENYDSIAENILGGISNVIPIGLCGFFYILVRKPKAYEVLKFEKTGKKKLLSVVAIGFTVCMLANILTNLFIDVVYSSTGINLNFDYETKDSNSIAEVVVYLISVAVVPAFSEEILFRGAILGSLRKYGDGFAVMVSAFFFGIFHGNLVQFPFAMIVGLVQGWAFVYTNSLLPAILIHFLNNGFSVMSDVIYTGFENANKDTILLDTVTYVIVILLAVISIISAAHLSKKDKSFLRLNKYEGRLDKKEVKIALFHSPTIIIAFVLLAVETLTAHLPYLL